MGKIVVLSDKLISQIAAGEVIERPASAVKELVENSIDAGATRITVEIEEGGMKKIRIVDNGIGIMSEDAVIAFERHSTSKLRTVDDLFTIKSLGFRGEALASIASIAQVVLRTRHVEGRVGTEIEIDGGKEIRNEETVCDSGTNISVYGLFKHTPVRKKYMKTERTEYGRIFEMLSRIALTHPEVGFKFVRDGKEVFTLASGQSLQERIRVLYGSQTSNALIPVRYDQSNLVIRGFIGKPELARRSRKYQFVFVNGRAIESRALGAAVREAFHSLLMHEKHPWYLLDIQIDPAMVDVNVHPRKLEVKFLNAQEVWRAVMGAVHHALENVMLSPVVREDNQEVFVEAPKLELSGKLRMHRSVFSAAEKKAEVYNIQGTLLRPLAQIANSYIVAEGEEGMVLIDQHAAHERVRYARLMNALEKEKVLSQGLLAPLEMDLGVDGAKTIKDNLAEFKRVGFELEPFGGSTYLLRAVPLGIENHNPEQILRDMVSDVKKNTVKDMREFLLTYTACRGAVKFGDPLTMKEMESLIADMEQTKHCTHCPHGRPAIVTLTFDSLETMFKRKNF